MDYAVSQLPGRSESYRNKSDVIEKSAACCIWDGQWIYCNGL